MFSSVLNRLANRHGSDKGSTVADRHRYAQLYDVLFHNEREGTRKVLELGLARGGPEAPIGGAVERHCGSPSVAMWIEYFPNAAIYGFDISDFAHLEEQFGRFCFLRGDCGSAADLSRLAAMVGDDVDIIIDDAVRVVPVVLQRLALVGKHRCAGGHQGGGRMVLRAEDVARGPAHLGAQRLQGLDQHRGLDSHVQAAGDTRALERLAGGVLGADGHQRGHLAFGDGDFLAAPAGQRGVGNGVVAVQQRLENGVHGQAPGG